MDARSVLDHEFLVAAYTVTWVIQLGYLAWLGAKARSQRREALRRKHASR
jgi:CcmD family protein